MTHLVDFFRVINMFIAILAVPVSISMFIQLSRECHLLPKLPKKLATVNTTLRYLFLGIAVSSLTNAFLSGIIVLGLHPNNMGEGGGIFFNLRNLIVNTFFTVSSWSFFLIRKGEKEGKK